MKKLVLVAAAIAAIGTITPALAEGVSVRIGDNGYHHRHFHERVVVRHDRGWHRGWEHHHRHGAKVVIR